MIPYLQIPSLPILPEYNISIHPFGLLVAAGILIGAKLTIRRGKKLGLDEEMVKNMIFWSVFTGFIVSHVFQVMVYQDISFAAKLKELPKLWTGMSSMGGFAGAVLGLILWCRNNRQPILPYADSLAYGLATGWMFGRMGCFVAHDHPGSLAGDFFLGVDYPCEKPPCRNVGDALYYVGSAHRRHDLGFYEILVAAALASFYFIAERWKPRQGFFVAIIAMYYGPIRFCLDYLRASDIHGADPRYGFGSLRLTPAQYAAILVTGVGVALMARVFTQPPKYPIEGLAASGAAPPDGKAAGKDEAPPAADAESGDSK